MVKHDSFTIDHSKQTDQLAKRDFRITEQEPAQPLIANWSKARDFIGIWWLFGYRQKRQAPDEPAVLTFAAV
jgi:hypothetical protein